MECKYKMINPKYIFMFLNRPLVKKCSFLLATRTVTAVSNSVIATAEYLSQRVYISTGVPSELSDMALAYKCAHLETNLSSLEIWYIPVFLGYNQTYRLSS